MLLILGFGLLAGVIAMIGWSSGRGTDADMGSVSHQWVSEHRLSQTQDSRR